MIELTRRQKHNFRKKYFKCANGCWKWQASISNGYGQFKVDTKLVGAHRVAFFLENDYLPEFVLHTCDNRACVNPEHLDDATLSQNQIDRAQRGPLTIDQKLTLDDVREARYLSAIGWTQQSIADRLGVARSTIGDIITGRTWSHIK